MAARGITPVTAALRRTLAAHGVAQRTGIPVEEVLAGGTASAMAGPSRRDVLKAAGAAVAGATLGGTLPASRANAATNPSVLVVGAGLAGLRAAHYLWRVKGIAATVYEGNNRAGGRCYSLRDYFPGMVVEHGGQLINTGHNAIRNLASSLGLSMDPVYGGSYGGMVDKYRIDGADYPHDAANADWGEVYYAMRNAQRAAPYPQTFDNHTDAGNALDNMTVNQWLDANVPGGLSSRFAKLMQSNAVAEYGLDPDQQSALNLIYLLGWNSQNSLDPLNGSDEKYVVRGGNDQLVTRMLDQLPAGTVRYGNRLVAVKQNANGSVRCSFKVGNKVSDVTADRVVLALPFSTLRDADLTQSEFSSVTLRAIRELDLGANAKIHVGVSRRPWVEQGFGGAAYTNLSGFQCGWDDSVNYPLPAGAFVLFPGRPAGQRRVVGSDARDGTGRAGERLPGAAGADVPGRDRRLHRQGVPRLLVVEPVVEGRVYLPDAGPVHDAVRRRRGARRQRALRRRAHQPLVLRLPQRGRRDRRARRPSRRRLKAG